ncbi:MAG TPA: BON domain-containing protein [Pyrinomonadaceae bacterium]|nr:BON domain-containing protein [Pyrinomonadaceae bacterium]
MKQIAVIIIAAITSLTFIACEQGANSNANVRTANTNTAVVVNTTPTTNSNANRWANTNITREEYDRNRAEYERDKGSSTIGQGANDSWLWFKTRAALLTTSDLRDSTINVDVVNDIVTLKGTVASAAQRTKAEQVAKDIDGVKSVKNELTVRADDSVTNRVVNGNTANRR